MGKIIEDLSFRKKSSGFGEFRKLGLGFACVALFGQILTLGSPGNPPITIWEPKVSRAMYDWDIGSYEPEERIAAASYASSTSASRPLTRDTVAIVTRTYEYHLEASFTALTLARSPASGLSPKTNTFKILGPAGTELQLVDPTSIAVADFNTPLAGQVRQNSSEDLVIGFNTGNHSTIAVLKDFDLAARRASQSRTDIPTLSASLLRFNCEVDSSGVCRYHPANDPAANVRAITVADLNCDGKKDIMILADNTYDANHDNYSTTPPGLRWFSCINTTPSPSSEPAGDIPLSYRCNGSGAFDLPHGSTRSVPDDVIIVNPSRFAREFSVAVAPDCSGNFEAVGYGGNAIYQIYGNISTPGRGTTGVEIDCGAPVKSARLVSMNSSGSSVARVVQIQPEDPRDSQSQAQWEGPIVDNSMRTGGASFQDLIPRIGVSISRGTECVDQPWKPIARGVAVDGGAVGFEYRVAAPFIAVDLVNSNGRNNGVDGIPEIIVGSAGAGRTSSSVQAAGELEEISLMAVGGDRFVDSSSTFFDLPRSSLQMLTSQEQSSASGEFPKVLASAAGEFVTPISPISGAQYAPDIAVILDNGDVFFTSNRYLAKPPSTTVEPIKAVSCPTC